MKNFYHISPQEKGLIWAQGAAIICVFAFFFYRSAWAIPLLLPLAFLYQKIAAAKLKSGKQEELRLRFKEMIEIVAGNLRAGYSVENAFLETGREMSRLHRADAPHIALLNFIKIGLENNIPLDVRLKEAGKISGVSEISEFAEVFGVAKNSGGNVIELIHQFATMIGDKIETEKEISVSISARRGEQRIMNVVPFAILLYIDISSPGFFSALYHNLTGILVMSACLAVYLAAYVMSVKMLKIEV